MDRIDITGCVMEGDIRWLVKCSTGKTNRLCLAFSFVFQLYVPVHTAWT